MKKQSNKMIKILKYYNEIDIGSIIKKKNK